MDALAETLDTEAAAAALVAEADGGWAVELTFAREPDAAAVRALVAEAGGTTAAHALTFSTVAPRDWIKASLADLRPVTVGRFVIHGAHDRDNITVNRTAIEIEAALAFGTGHHATTHGCLLALDALVKQQRTRRRPATNLSRKDMATRVPQTHPPLEKGRWSKWHRLVVNDRQNTHMSLPCPAGAGLQVGSRRQQRILDVGTGSGVLAMAAAKTLRSPVLASDIDRTAVKSAVENVRRNRTAPLIEVVEASGLAAPRIRARAPYDLVFANILLGPLKQLAAPMARVLRPGAQVILSGLLSRQANAALAAYRAHGLVLERRIERDGWATLVMARASRRRVTNPRAPSARTAALSCS